MGFLPLRCALSAMLLVSVTAAAQTPAEPPATPAGGPELPVHAVPNLGPGAEFYFSPDSTHLIGNAGDLNSGDQTRLTYSDVFDGYPSISPDGHWLAFTSTRGAPPGSHTTGIYLQDISSLHLGP